MWWWLASETFLKVLTVYKSWLLPSFLFFSWRPIGWSGTCVIRFMSKHYTDIYKKMLLGYISRMSLIKNKSDKLAVMCIVIFHVSKVLLPLSELQASVCRQVAIFYTNYRLLQQFSCDQSIHRDIFSLCDHLHFRIYTLSYCKLSYRPVWLGPKRLLSPKVAVHLILIYIGFNLIA